MHLRGQQRRHPQAHELAENVAQRQGMQKAKRMKPAFVAQIFLDLAIQHFDTGQHIAVGVDDAFRGGCGSRGEENLQRSSGFSEGSGSNIGERRQGGRKIFEGKFRGGFRS